MADVKKLAPQNVYLTNIPLCGIVFLVCQFSLQFKLIVTLFYRHKPKIDILKLVTEHIHV